MHTFPRCGSGFRPHVVLISTLPGKGHRRRIVRAGLPAADTWSGMSRTTTLPAPMTAFFPMVTPGQTITPPPSHAFSPIVMGADRSHPARRRSWSPPDAAL
jgi:hypothetical protein